VRNLSIYGKTIRILGVVTLVLFFIYNTILAKTASQNEMDHVCANWLLYTIYENGSWAKSDNPQILESTDIVNGELVMARYYKISPDGYIVVPTLKELPPIMAYSETGQPEINDRHGIYALLRDVLIDRTDRFINFYGSMEFSPNIANLNDFDRNIKNSWDTYSMDNPDFHAFLQTKSRGGRDQVGPFLTTTWSQTAPYNNYCPWGDGNRCVVWCVATALAQILWYHQWPPAGFGHTVYQWNGDQSCGGSSPGLLLSANFSDNYGYSGIIDEIAEIGFEVGMSYNVDYGVCYSIGYAAPIFNLLPDNFAYLDSVTEEHRNLYSAEDWFVIIQNELNNNRPIDYLIYNHMIVADGWATDEGLMYYHMNYGWGGGSNGWYAIDNLYCGWEGCDPMVEVMYTNIYPDKSIMFYADTIAGDAPLDLNFTASSDLSVDSWIWDFGNGDSAFEQSPEYTYKDAGIYDVSLTINYGDSSKTKTRTEYIYVLADSITAGGQQVEVSETIEIPISIKNSIPLSQLIIPIKYDGALELTYDSFSTDGCRTESFQDILALIEDDGNKRLAYSMTAWLSGYSDYPYLPVGEGNVIKLYFTVDPGVLPGQQTIIRIDNFLTYYNTFYGSIYGQPHDYIPTIVSGTIEIETLCGDANGDGDINIFDITHIISYLYLDGPPPVSLDAADVNNDGVINIFDVTHLIAFLYMDGDPLDCP